MGRSIIIMLLIVMCSCSKKELTFTPPVDEDFQLPLLLRLNGRDCLLDHQRSILKYSIKKEDLAEFEPLINFQEFSSVTFNGKKLINNQVNSLRGLEFYNKYELVIYNSGEVKHFELIFTDLPLVQIVTHDFIYNEPKSLCRFIVNYPDHKQAAADHWTGIEHRGASSLKYDKKSMTVETLIDKNMERSFISSFFDFNPNSKWILDAMYTDLSRLRNKFAFSIWNSLKSDSSQQEYIGIESQHVEVFINYESLGLFSFSEKYTSTFLDLTEEAILFKGIENSDFSKFYDFPAKPPSTAFWADYEQIIPKPSERLVWQDFENLAGLITKASDQEFRNQIGDEVELRNAIDYHLFINLISGSDGVGKNWHLLKRSYTSKFIIVPWDLDGTFGINIQQGEILADKYITNGLFKRLEKTDPEGYNERLRSRWKELRSRNFSDDFLITKLQSMFNQLRDYDIINVENDIWQCDIDLEKEEEYMIRWIMERISFLDQYYMK